MGHIKWSTRAEPSDGRVDESTTSAATTTSTTSAASTTSTASTISLSHAQTMQAWIANLVGTDQQTITSPAERTVAGKP